ncbi:hypothetical protein, partial [Salmonella sp. s54395]|uniref:hypothetical protein n=1 Tax=Salmonella sp. s54395 TaxID=3159664 RepID=UPI00397FB2B6
MKQNLHYKDLIPVIEKCLAKFSRHVEGEIDQPVRTVVGAPKSNGLYFIMPVYDESENMFAIKIVTLYPDNE